jgi:hypothetical protein
MILLHTAVLATPAVVGLLADLDLFDCFLDGRSISGQTLHGAKLRGDLLRGVMFFFMASRVVWGATLIPFLWNYGASWC